MADFSLAVPLPPSVEQMIEKICTEQSQPPLDTTVRRKLASLGEEATLQILRTISAAQIKRSFGGFIIYMAKNASPDSPQRGVSQSPQNRGPAVRFSPSHGRDFLKKQRQRTRYQCQPMASRQARHPPTASERQRRRRQCEPDVVAPPPPNTDGSPPPPPTLVGDAEQPAAKDVVGVVEQPIVEDAVVAPAPRDRTTFPSSPQDPSILHSFGTHIADSIWRRQDDFVEREPLKCFNHAHKITCWQPKNDRLIGYIKQSGLSFLMHCSYRHSNRIAVSAFVKRWHPETSSFHLPFGEMTITLDDVASLLHVPVIGKAVTCPKLSFANAQSLLERVLGVEANVAHRELGTKRGQSVKLEWLHTNFSTISNTAPDVEVQRAARGYLLYLLGCTLFADKSRIRVPVAFLYLLEDLQKVHTYAWGAASLAFLYYHLGQATRATVLQIGGYPTLLEGWIYEHFPLFQPCPRADYIEVQPRVLHWLPKVESGNAIDHVVSMQETLDDLFIDEVEWDPYTTHRDVCPFDEIVYFRGCLICFDYVEPYMPDRVFRQFGRVQPIPRAPLLHVHTTRGENETRNKKNATYDYVVGQWVSWLDNVLSEESRRYAVSYPYECKSDYMEWYARISHIRVQPLQHQRTPPRHRDSLVEGEKCIARVLDIARQFSQKSRDKIFRQSNEFSHGYDQIIRGLEGGTRHTYTRRVRARTDVQPPADRST